MEIWKAIPGYENYEVSDLGNVRSLNYNKTGKTKSLKKILTPHGYYIVNLCKNKKRKAFGIHQLVAMAFLNHTINAHVKVPDHINAIKTDNRLENLRIITQRENVFKKRDLSPGVYRINKSEKFKVQIEINGKTKYIGSFETSEEASQAYQKALSEI